MLNNAPAIADNTALARNKQPAPRITARVKAAIDYMVETGNDYQKAAAQAGLTTYALRLALDKPHVLNYLHKQKHVLRAARSIRNIHRLCEIADADNNMPAVNAIKALEQLSDETASKTVHAQAPGVTIVIVQQTQANEIKTLNANDIDAVSTSSAIEADTDA